MTVSIPPGTLFDEERLLAAIEGIGRAAANALELGWTHDDGPRPGEWYASASYKGARVIVEDQHGPDAAAENLFLRVACGGQCVHCGATITARSNGLTLTISGHPVLDEDALEENGTAGLCIWERNGAHWLRGCDGGYGPLAAPGPNRAQRRRQARAQAMRR